MVDDEDEEEEREKRGGVILYFVLGRGSNAETDQVPDEDRAGGKSSVQAPGI